MLISVLQTYPNYTASDIMCKFVKNAQRSGQPYEIVHYLDGIYIRNTETGEIYQYDHVHESKETSTGLTDVTLSISLVPTDLFIRIWIATNKK